MIKNYLRNLLFLATTISFAQNKLITGKITDINLNPLLGVKITLIDSKNTTYTNSKGTFKLYAPNKSTLYFTHKDYIPKSFVVKKTTTEIQIQLVQSPINLKEVTVTALGIHKNKSELGYSTQLINGSSISEIHPNNPINALAGKVPGLQISNASGNLGGSTRILLRGPSSITQNNQPLIIVDGIPFDNSNFNDINTQVGDGGKDFGDTVFDLDSNNIENINILKGGVAGALYGSRASNGVLLITTKKAKEEIEINSGISFESINIAPKVQQLYGAGRGTEDPNILESPNFNTIDVNGSTFNVVDYASDQSWGPRYNPNIQVLHWDATDPEIPNQFLKTRAWVNPKNNARSFFRTATSFKNSVSYGKSFKKGYFRTSFSNNNSQGIVPNTSLKKTAIGLKGAIEVTPKLTINGGINFTNTKGFNRPESGYGEDNSIILKFYQFSQTSLDYDRLKAFTFPDGTQRTWNRTSFEDSTPLALDNPYWTINKNIAKDNRDRWYGNLNLNYQFNNNFSISAKTYGDTYKFKIQDRIAIGSVALSRYNETNHFFEEFNYEALLKHTTHFSQNAFNLTSFIGVNRRDVKTRSFNGATRGGLKEKNIFNLNNSVEEAEIITTLSQKRINSLFSSATLGYNKTLFLTLTGRNDWSSTLPNANNSYFYPSISSSFVFSKLLQHQWLSYGKARVGWSKIGNDTEPFRLQNTFTNRVDFLGNPRFSTSDTNLNDNLKPEEKNTWEAGLEMAFIKNRIHFDITYYNETTTNLITPIEVDSATGFSEAFLNVGSLTNQGIETSLSLTPIKTKNWQWNLTWGFSKNKNKLNSLTPSITSLQIAELPFNEVSLAAVVGKSYGQIRGTNFVYDNNGNRVIDDFGNYMATQEFENLGSVLPNYNTSFQNTLNYKKFNVSFLIDIQEGGHYRSLTNAFGRFSGILEETTENNIREEGIVLNGVTGNVTFNPNGSYTVTNTQTNTTRISAKAYNQGYFTGPNIQNVFRSDYIKLREITLGYTFSLNTTTINVSLFGRNLLTWGLDNPHIDPEVVNTGSGNIQGSEGGAIPSTRTYGFNLKLKL